MTGWNKERLYKIITKAVIEELQTQQIEIVEEPSFKIPVSISARHVHLQKEHADLLFGENYRFTKYRELSQPGQFSCEEQVAIVGPKGSFERVRILAPLRKQTQVEISRTDARKLGLNPPVRHSGDLAGSAPITIIGPKGKVELNEGCIIPDRHIHMSPKDAEYFGVVDGQKVKIEVGGEKGGMMYNVTIRVSKRYALDMHIDTDDANAFDITNHTYAKLIK